MSDTGQTQTFCFVQ